MIDFANTLQKISISLEKLEPLIGTVGELVRYYAKKEKANRATVRKFSQLGLFPKLVVAHFIESDSMKLFYTGLCIVKHLLRIDAVRMTQILVEYEESCQDDRIREGFLTIVWCAV